MSLEVLATVLVVREATMPLGSYLSRVITTIALDHLNPSCTVPQSNNRPYSYGVLYCSTIIIIIIYHPS